MKKIAVFGGTFDPVHVEHVEIALSSIKELNLDKLIVMPTYQPPHKTEKPTSPKDRIEMLKRAFIGHNNIEISDFEINNQSKSYTYITAEHFKSLYPDDKLYFIIGGDSLTGFKTWKNPERILKATRLAVFSRDNFFTDWEAEKKYFKDNFNDTFIRLNYVGKGVSSTKARLYFSMGLGTEGIVPDGVIDYVLENNLYVEDGVVAFLKKVLTKKRLIHTANVTITALSKVGELNLDKEKVYLSAMLHDCAKYLSPTDFKDFYLDPDVPSPVVHAFLGAHVVEKVLKITDPEIIDAIKYHTTGKADMSTLLKLIFLSDMVEEGRSYDGVEKLRELFIKDFDKCLVEALKEELIHLKNKGQPVYFETVNAYNYYVKN